MALHELLDRSRPGARPLAFVLSGLVPVAAFGLARLLLPEGVPASSWLPLVTAALTATTFAGLIDRACRSTVILGVGSALAVSAGAFVGVLVLALAAPGSWGAFELGSLEPALPLPLRVEAHEGLADGPEVFGRFLLAGGMIFLAGAFFGSGGAMFLLLLQTFAWAGKLAEMGRNAGGIPQGVTPMLKAMGAAATYSLPAWLGLACLGIAAHAGIMRFFGLRDTDGSQRPVGLAVIVGLCLLFLGGAVELFGGGMLQEMLRGG